MSAFDLLVRRARLVDGTGAPAVVADLAVRAGRIVAVGEIGSGSARRIVDADGLALAPGFIDAHCHDDRAIIDTPLLEPKISQGVTTVVNGNCGISIAPVLPGRPAAKAPLGAFTAGGARFERFGDYFAALEASPPAVNSACFCGHSNLRHAAMDSVDRAATPAEITHMAALLDGALRDGALGLSTGLYYPAASAAPTEEVVALAHTVARHGARYATHMRNEEDHVTDSLAETFRIGREAGVPVIVSHHKCMSRANHGKSAITLPMFERAAREQDVGLDAYPYRASSTLLFPERVAKCDRVVITWSEPMPDAAGRDLADIAAQLGCSDIEAARRLLPAGAIYFQMSEVDVRRILAFPDTMIGSDGIVFEPHPHPRAWGTFPRVLGHYARDVGLFSLEEAVRKMTSLTAARFGLAGRGRLAPGYHADLVLFDPARVIDVADFADPCRPAEGIEQVFVNGEPVWARGSATGRRPGRCLRRTGG
ncbi:MAG: D-aminoacylase [Burkholderiaceae bacterium]